MYSLSQEHLLFRKRYPLEYKRGLKHQRREQAKWAKLEWEARKRGKPFVCVHCGAPAFDKQFAGDKSMPPPWCPNCEEIWKEQREAMFRENDEDEDESVWLRMLDVQADA